MPAVNGQSALEGLQAPAREETPSTQPEPTLEGSPAADENESGKSESKAEKLTNLVAPATKTLNEAEKQELSDPIFVRARCGKLARPAEQHG
jgi:hypothetical protein